MITTKISVKPHLAEYCYGKYSNCSNDPVEFPYETELYHTVWDLMQKRPANAGVDSGNLELALPCSKMRTDYDFVKNPQVYNYLSDRSAKLLETKIEIFMFAEIHHELMFNKRAYGTNYKDTVHIFMRRYAIDSVTEDMYIKDFYRWRKKLFQRNNRRKS